MKLFQRDILMPVIQLVYVFQTRVIQLCRPSRWCLVVQQMQLCTTECPMGTKTVFSRDCMVLVEKMDEFAIKHDDGAMHHVIIR